MLFYLLHILHIGLGNPDISSKSERIPKSRFWKSTFPRPNLYLFTDNLIICIFVWIGHITFGGGGGSLSLFFFLNSNAIVRADFEEEKIENSCFCFSVDTDKFWMIKKLSVDVIKICSPTKSVYKSFGHTVDKQTSPQNYCLGFRAPKKQIYPLKTLHRFTPRNTFSAYQKAPSKTVSDHWNNITLLQREERNSRNVFVEDSQIQFVTIRLNTFQNKLLALNRPYRIT